MRYLVCGGRTYSDAELLNRRLDELLNSCLGLTIICGYDPDDIRYQGADEMAFRWAVDRGVPVYPFPAPWKKMGRAAGPVRNRRMLEWGKPTAVLAAPGGTGTANMCAQAERAGISPELLLWSRHKPPRPTSAP